MGCDIHFYVEVKDKDGVWKMTPPLEQIDEYDGEPIYGIPFEKRIYKGRNYDLFAILADVRNGYGFAGVNTGGGFNPISMPRGVPRDASSDFLRIAEQYGCDGHSHSWLDLQDLLTYDWTQTTKKIGVLDLKEYEDWTRCIYWGRDAGESPKSYCSMVSGGNVKHISNEHMDKYADLLRKVSSTEERIAFLKDHSNLFTQVEWEIPYYSAAGEFWSSIMPQLLSLSIKEGVHNVRLVFFFDN